MSPYLLHQRDAAKVCNALFSGLFLWLKVFACQQSGGGHHQPSTYLIDQAEGMSPQCRGRLDTQPTPNQEYHAIDDEIGYAQDQ